jgi:hypothetical protein
MKVSIGLTLERLLRAMKARAHGIADDIESGYRRGAAEPGRDARDAGNVRRNDDDVPGT